MSNTHLYDMICLNLNEKCDQKDPLFNSGI